MFDCLGFVGGDALVLRARVYFARGRNHLDFWAQYRAEGLNSFDSIGILNLFHPSSHGEHFAILLQLLLIELAEQFPD